MLNRACIQIGIFAISALGIVGLAACDDSGRSHDAISYLTGEEAVKEYRERAAELSLPPGASWEKEPRNLSTLDDEGKEQNFALTVGAQEAEYWWLCSWYKHVLDASEETVRSDAIDEIEKYRDFVIWKYSDDNGHDAFNAALSAANLGDLSGISGDYEVNCPQ